MQTLTVLRKSSPSTRRRRRRGTQVISPTLSFPQGVG